MHLSKEQLESCLDITLSQDEETEWSEFKENFHGAEELGQTISLNPTQSHLIPLNPTLKKK